MAKKDNFFIRAKVTQDGSGFVSEEIDLGSFVNVGAKSSVLLRIHSISVQIQDDSEPFKGPFTNGATLNIGYDLTTQKQSTLVPLDNKSVVASGRYMISDQTVIDFDSDIKDALPQMWKNGYLVATESLYLSTEADSASTNGDYHIAVLLECSSETATVANATSLALSQQ